MFYYLLRIIVNQLRDKYIIGDIYKLFNNKLLYNIIFIYKK